MFIFDRQSSPEKADSERDPQVETCVGKRGTSQPVAPIRHRQAIEAVTAQPLMQRPMPQTANVPTN
jgi:hypothetical protein